jgi:hypothetical protein
MGRQISQSDAITKDHIAIFGLIIGIRGIQDLAFKETSQKWIFSLLQDGSPASF